MTISRKTKRDLHAFDADGMVLCNPRDREAAHRAQAEGIATDVREDVTCPNCIPLLFKLEKSRPQHPAAAARCSITKISAANSTIRRLFHNC